MTDRTTFGHDTTADEVLEGIDLTGKRVLITGASSGIGEETARAMAAKGAEVIITARNMPKGETVVSQIKASTGNQQVSVMSVELGSFASIRDFASDFLSKYDSLDYLINNAGVMACPQSKTEDGFEMQFGVNHLGHFLLTSLLTPALIKAAPARVVNLSSRAHRISPVILDDIQFENREYNRWAAYGQSKTANILFSVELDKRLSPEGVRAFAVHPGVIQTELSRHMDEADFERVAQLRSKTIPAGAATSVYAATAPELEGMGGIYLDDCNTTTVDPEPESLNTVRPYAIDTEAAKELWRMSEEMVGL